MFNSLPKSVALSAKDKRTKSPRRSDVQVSRAESERKSPGLLMLGDDFYELLDGGVPRNKTSAVVGNKEENKGRKVAEKRTSSPLHFQTPKRPSNELNDSHIFRHEATQLKFGFGNAVRRSGSVKESLDSSKSGLAEGKHGQVKRSASLKSVFGVRPQRDEGDLAQQPIPGSSPQTDSVMPKRGDDTGEKEKGHHVAKVQDRFPNDDLQLIHSKKFRGNQGRRRSVPSASFLRSHSKNALPSPDLPHISGGTSQPANRTFLLEAAVQLTEGLQTQERYFFLFNDLLLIAKHRSNATFKLKQRVRVCEIWVTSCLGLVSETPLTSDTSFVIGWPTTNMIVTFSNKDVKAMWLETLKQQVDEEKSKEHPRALILKILNVDMGTYSACKCVTVGNNEQAKDLVKRCLDEFHIQEGQPEDYQLWVKSCRYDAPYPLIGHEHPYSIKMSHVRDSFDGATENSLQPMEVDFNANDSDVQFILRHKKKDARRQSFDDSLKRLKKTKKSPLINFFRRVQHKPEGGTELAGKLFGHPLSSVCDGASLPSTLMVLLQHLFLHAPFCPGVFRKPGNYKRCQELRRCMDAGENVRWDDEQILVACSVLKEYLRSLPDCLLTCDLYDKWTELLSVDDLSEKKELVIRNIGLLPLSHQSLLRHVMCLLHHIHAREDVNKMNLQAITVCVSPSLIWCSPSSASGNALADTVKQSEESEKGRRVVQLMLEYFEDIFGHESVNLFGAPPTSLPSISSKGRHDSCTDSDSGHSLLGSIRCDNSSMDSLEQEFYDTGAEFNKSDVSSSLGWESSLASSDPRMFKNMTDDPAHPLHLSSTYRNIPQEEDITGIPARRRQLSKSFDSTLGQSLESHRDSIPVPPPRLKKGRRSDGPASLYLDTDNSDYIATQSHLRKVSSTFSDEGFSSNMNSVEYSDEQGDTGHISRVVNSNSLSDVRSYDLAPSRSTEKTTLKKSASGSQIYSQSDKYPAIVTETFTSRQLSSESADSKSAPNKVHEMQEILQQAKANVHHSHQYIRQAKVSRHNATSSTSPPHYTHHHNVTSRSMSPTSQHHPTALSDQEALTLSQMSVDTTGDSDDSLLNESSSAVIVKQATIKPINKPDSTSLDATLDSRSSSSSLADHTEHCEGTTAEQIPVVKQVSSLHSDHGTNQASVLHPQESAQETSCHERVSQSYLDKVHPQLSSSASSNDLSPAFATKRSKQQRMLTRTHAVDESTPTDGCILRKKCMTSRGSDIFPSRLVENLYRQSLDESAIFKAHDSSIDSHDHTPSLVTRDTSPVVPPVSSGTVKSMPSQTARLQLQRGLERSYSDTTILNMPASSSGPRQKVKHLPSYQEATQKRGHYNVINEASDQELLLQREKNLRARQLYEESLKRHSSDHGNSAKDKKDCRTSSDKQTMSDKTPSSTTRTHKAPLPLPSYEQACVRAELIREQKRSGNHKSSPINRSSPVDCGHVTMRNDDGTEKDQTLTSSSRASHEIKSNSSKPRKGKDKTHERRIRHRNSDSKLSRKVDLTNVINARVGRSKSDSSELVQKTNKYRGLTMCHENKENISREDLEAVWKNEKETIMKLFTNRALSPDLAGKVSKDVTNEQVKVFNIVMSPMTPADRDEIRSQNPDARSVRNRKWHKELAEKYTSDSAPRQTVVATVPSQDPVISYSHSYQTPRNTDSYKKRLNGGRRVADNIRYARRGSDGDKIMKDLPGDIVSLQPPKRTGAMKTDFSNVKCSDTSQDSPNLTSNVAKLRNLYMDTRSVQNEKIQNRVGQKTRARKEEYV